jgi:hypothetical protein
MGQHKGNPQTDRSVQNQAYSSLYTGGTSQSGVDRRDVGTKPVMIDDEQTLDEVVDSGSLRVTKGYAKDTDLTDGTINARFDTLTANEYHITVYSSSVLYAGGSNKFGNDANDVTEITGSFNVSGSTYQFGNNTLVGNTTLSGSIEVSGSSNFKNSIFIVTGSAFFTGSHRVIGQTVISGSIYIASGSSYYRGDHKLFNYGQFASLETQSGSANTAYAMKLANPLGDAEGVRITNNASGFPTRLTVDNSGLYNIQFSAQLTNTANTNITFDIWFAYTGSNIDNSNTQLDVNKSAGQLGRSVAAWNLLTHIAANDYFEIMWNCTAATGQIVYIGTQTTPTRPAIPSVIATITQIA